MRLASGSAFPPGVDVAMWIDGPLLPVGDGGSQLMLGLINAINHYTDLSIIPVICLWGFDDPNHYIDLDWPLVLLRPDEYFYPSPRVLSLLRSLGVRVVFLNTLEVAVRVVPVFASSAFKTAMLFHNVDSVLLERLNFPQPTIAEAKLSTKFLLNEVDIAFARSEVDRKHLLELDGTRNNIHVARGGIELEGRSACSEKPSQTKAIIVANLHYRPNRDGVEELAASWRNGTLRVVGPAPEHTVKLINSNSSMTYVGQVKDLSAELERANIGLVPVSSGSGTRMKILDYMAHCLPVLTTSIGIEGLDLLEPFVHVEDNIGHFSERCVEILEDNRTFALARHGRLILENYYGWQNCVNEFAEPLKQLINRQ